MEILKSKINEFPDYFKVSTSNEIKSFNKSKINYSNTNHVPNILRLISLFPQENTPPPIKDTDTQVSHEKNFILKNHDKIERLINISNYNNNNNSKSKTNILIPLRKTSLNESTKIINPQKFPKSKYKKFFLDKLNFSYFPTKKSFEQNNEKNKNIQENNKDLRNNVHYIKKVGGNNNNQKGNLYDMKNLNMNNNPVSLINTYLQKNNSFYNSDNNQNYIDDYKINSNEAQNLKFHNPMLMKDVEISKLLNRTKTKKRLNISQQKLEGPSPEKKVVNSTQYNKIFISFDIIKKQRTIKDLLYFKLMSNKKFFNKSRNIIKNMNLKYYYFNNYFINSKISSKYYSSNKTSKANIN